MDLSRKDTIENIIIKKYNEEAYCFYPIGWISRGNNDGQPQIASETCKSVYDDYVSKVCNLKIDDLV